MREEALDRGGHSVELQVQVPGLDRQHVLVLLQRHDAQHLLHAAVRVEHAVGHPPVRDAGQGLDQQVLKRSLDELTMEATEVRTSSFHSSIYFPS